MIILSVKNYETASYFIKKLDLKKDLSIKKFSIFKKYDYLLIITGEEKIKTVIALTYLFSNIKYDEKNLVFNIEFDNSTNDIYIINKIFDEDSDTYFYPDMFFKNEFKEKGMKGRNLFSGALQVGLTFLYSYQNIFLQSSFCEKNVEIILDWVDNIKNNFRIDTKIFTEDENEIINNTIYNLKLTSNMKNEFLQYLSYYKLLTNNILLINDYKHIIVSSKDERNKYFEDFKSKFFAHIY